MSLITQLYSNVYWKNYNDLTVLCATIIITKSYHAEN